MTARSWPRSSVRWAASHARVSEIMRLWREVKVQEQVYELLTAQLEEARIRETRDSPTVQVLDQASGRSISPGPSGRSS